MVTGTQLLDKEKNYGESKEGGPSGTGRFCECRRGGAKEKVIRLFAWLLFALPSRLT